MIGYFKNIIFSNKNIIAYLLTSIIVGLISVFITTYLTNNLTTDQYGRIETFMSISALLTSIIMFGGSTFISSYNNLGSEKNEYQLAFILILCNSIILVSFSVLYIIYFNNSVLVFLFFLVLYVILNSVYNIILTSFQLDRNVFKYSLFTISFSLLSSLLTVFSIEYSNDYFGRLFSLVSALILITFGAYIAFNYKSFSLYSFREMIKIAYVKGLYLAISQVFSWILEKSDRIIILYLLNASLLGVYGLGYQFGMLMLLIQSAVSKAWIPYLQSKIKLNRRIDIKKRIFKISIFYFIAVFFISGGAWFYISTFINKNYYDSIYIVPLVTLGYAFDGIWKLFNSIFVVEEKYKLFSAQIIVIGFFNIFTTFIFVKYIGVLGAAISTAFSFFIGVCWSYFYISSKLNWFVSNE